MGERRGWLVSGGYLPGLLLALWLGFLPLPASAQTASGAGEDESLPLTPRGFSVGVGVGRLSRADELVSPLRYRGYSWRLSLGAELATTRTIKRIYLAYSPPTLTTSITRGGSHVQRGHRVGLEATWFRRVAETRGGDLSLHLGGTLATQGSLYDHWYKRDDSESWAQFFALLEPGVAWHLRLPGGAVLWQELTAPLAGFVARPPYQGLTEMPRPSFAGPGRVTGIQQALHYRRDLGRGWKWGVSYSFQGLRYSKPRPLVQTHHTLTVHLIFLGRGS